MREFFERLIDEKDQQTQRLIDERDKRYDARFRASEIAVSAAFEAQKEQMTAQQSAQQTSVSAALAAAKEAVVKAEVATDKRFDSVNEFRQTLSDQTKEFMGRSETTVLFKALEDKLVALQASYEGRLEALRLSEEKNNENLAKDITALRLYRSETTGKSLGANALWGILAGVIIVIVTIGGFVIALLPHIVTK